MRRPANNEKPAIVKLAIVQYLQDLGRELNRTPTTADVKSRPVKGGHISLYTIKDTFGSLPVALRAANLPLTYKQEFTQPQLIEQLQDLAQALGRPVTMKDVADAARAGTCARPETFKRAFATIGNAIQKAGVGMYEEYTKSELISQYRALYLELGRPPGNRDIREAARKNKCAGITYFRKIAGGLERVRIELGIFERNSRRTLIAQLKGLSEELGRPPMAKEVEHASRAGTSAAVGTFQSKFGSYNAALRAAGFQPRRVYSRGQLIQFLRRLADQLGHRPTVRDLERVSAGKEGPGITPYKKWFGTFQNAIEAAGLELKPRKEKARVRKDRPRRDILDQLTALVHKLHRMPTLKDVDEAHTRGECIGHTIIWREFGGLIPA
ncbi:MAG: homing endonuclease associated repeat-containing protein, partial [Blastocatellia bacterium]